MAASASPSPAASKDSASEDYGYYEGVAIYREFPNQENRFARAFRYHAQNDFSTIFSFDVGSANPVNLSREAVLKMITFQEFHQCELTSDSEWSALGSYRQDLVDTVRRFPNAAGYLQGIISRVEDCLANRASGMVRHNGRWISRNAYEKLVQAEQEEGAKRQVEQQARYTEETKFYQDEAKGAAARVKNLTATPTTIAGRF